MIRTTAVYPVGILANWRHGCLNNSWRYLRYQAKRRNWRAIRNHFNGYLAEHDACGHNCGRGWTRRAAERRNAKLCKKWCAERDEAGA